MRHQLADEDAKSREVAARPGETGDQAPRDRVDAGHRRPWARRRGRRRSAGKPLGIAVTAGGATVPPKSRSIVVPVALFDRRMLMIGGLTRHALVERRREIRVCGARIAPGLEIPVDSRFGEINSRFGGKKFPVLSSPSRSISHRKHLIYNRNGNCWANIAQKFPVLSRFHGNFAGARWVATGGGYHPSA